MHNRLKVRSSEEEAARKKKEQEQKVTAYRAAMKLILEKKSQELYDDEMMSLTGSVLSRNPDITTLWNLRRLCILRMQDQNSVDIDLNGVFQKDLDFTETCLFANPKSYCVWHHRCWILENCPEPNWNREVDVCTKYLKLDERNFHVWDYRRYVVEKAQVPAENELDFCTEKINKNFSNYSSWHYRSKLLPILYPHETDRTRPINEEKLKEELEMVLTACFTDPDDSSAWFYQRWLLGYSQPELDVVAFKLCQTFAVVSFTKAVNLHKCSLSLDATANFETSQWLPIESSGVSDYSNCWLLEMSMEINTNSDTKFVLEFIDESGGVHHLNVIRNGRCLSGIKMPKFGHEFETTVVDELKQQLDNCNQLLEYEEDSKWTLLTAALLMRAINRKEYHEKTLDHLEKLKQVDPMRIGYYTDLANKWSIEQKLEEWITNGDEGALLDLSNMNLVNIFYEQYLCVTWTMNVSGNPLSNAALKKMWNILGCRVSLQGEQLEKPSED